MMGEKKRGYFPLADHTSRARLHADDSRLGTSLWRTFGQVEQRISRED